MSGVLNGPIPFIFEELKPRVLCPEFSFIGVHLHSQCGQGKVTFNPVPQQAFASSQSHCPLRVVQDSVSGINSKIHFQILNTEAKDSVSRIGTPSCPLPTPTCPPAITYGHLHERVRRGRKGGGKTGGQEPLNIFIDLASLLCVLLAGGQSRKGTKELRRKLSCWVR